MCLPFSYCRSGSNAIGVAMHCVIVAINIDGWCCCVMVGEREETDEVYAVENPGRRVAKTSPPI